MKPDKITRALGKAIPVGFPLTSISGSRSSILGKGMLPDKVFTHDNRQGGDWDLFGISSWLNDVLMAFDKITVGNTQEYLSPYKSAYLPFSIKESKVGNVKIHLSGEWILNNRIGGQLNSSGDDDNSWNQIQTSGQQSHINIFGNKLVVSQNWLLNSFDHFLVSLRRDFSQRYIMNSILPKSSKDIGNSILTEVGNWGEYLTTHEFSTLPDIFMGLEEFDPDIDESQKYQDSHGVLLILGSNHISGTKKYSTINIHKTNHIHYLNKDMVYKDFLSKPIICTIDGRTESHFSIGSSIGYKSI